MKHFSFLTNDSSQDVKLLTSLCKGVMCKFFGYCDNGESQDKHSHLYSLGGSRMLLLCKIKAFLFTSERYCQELDTSYLYPTEELYLLGIFGYLAVPV